MAAIFIISPNYLQAIAEEASAFETITYGYGNFESAYRGLLDVNVSEVIGWVYVADRFPKNFKSMLKFMRICDAMKSNRKFLILLPQHYSYVDNVNYSQFKYLNVVKATFDIMTDTIVKRSIYGSIFKEVYTPYVGLAQSVSKPLKEYKTSSIHYSSCISKTMQQIIKPCTAFSSLEDAINNDFVLQALRSSSEEIWQLRILFLAAHFKDEIIPEKAKEEILKLAKKSDELPKDYFCLFHGLLGRITL